MRTLRDIEQHQLNSLIGKGTPVFVRAASGWSYGSDPRPLEQGQLVILEGLVNDAKLVSTGLVGTFAAKPEAAPCKACRKNFADASFLAMHTRRVHEKPDPRVRDAK